MPKGNTLSRLLIASLAAAAVAAPAAVAKPIDPAQLDMHASTVTKPVSAQQDLRTEAAAKPASAQQDLRSEAAADQSRAPVRDGRFPGPPVFPSYPRAIAVAIPDAPAAEAVDGGGDGGVDLPVALLAIAGTLALGGGLTVAALRHRTRVAH